MDSLRIRKEQIAVLAKEIYESTGSSSCNPTFVARDLGFPDHTKIHDSVRMIVSEFAAEVFFSYGGTRNRADLLEQRINDAVRTATHYGQTEGSHQKMWVISSMLKYLMGRTEYDRFVKVNPDWFEGVEP